MKFDVTGAVQLRCNVWELVATTFVKSGALSSSKKGNETVLPSEYIDRD